MILLCGGAHGSKVGMDRDLAWSYTRDHRNHLGWISRLLWSDGAVYVGSKESIGRHHQTTAPTRLGIDGWVL